MRILLPEEIRMADELTCQTQNLTSIDLMERAALRFALHLIGRFGYLENGLIVCGPGNNGGDGLAIARILSSLGLSVSVFLPSAFTSYSADYLKNRGRLPASVPVHIGGLAELNYALNNRTWIGDALFGVGINRPLSGDVREMVEALNRFSGLRLSVDMPSGIFEEMPVGATAFKAHWTGTFHAPKIPLLLPFFQEFTEAFDVVDIGLEVPPASTNSYYYLQNEEVAAIVRTRRKFSHKGTYGHALVIGGSYGKMGAAVLACRGALHAGAGRTTWFGPECGTGIMQISIPEVMCKTGKGHLSVADLPDLGDYSSIGIGPGLGTDAQTAQAIKALLKGTKVPLVLDADALNLLSLNKDWLTYLPANCILTPHPKEFERLAGKSKTDLEMLDKAKEFAQKHAVFIVLKNAHTCITEPNGVLHFNSTGNPGMAKGGSGDVLTGLLTGLLAQGYTPSETGRLGVFLHGLAGDLAAEKYGVESMTATHLINELGSAFSVLHEKRSA